MATKALERLMFAQGDLCFFCAKRLPRDEASVEHLVPSSRAGTNSDDNCVACCKSLNSLFGSMSLKEKIKVVLNQEGNFRCPNGHSDESISLETPEEIEATGSRSPTGFSTAPEKEPVQTVSKPAAAAPKKSKSAPAPKSPLAEVIEHLKGLKKAKPGKVKTLTSTIKALLKREDQHVEQVIDELKAKRKVIVIGNKVTYKL